MTEGTSTSEMSVIFYQTTRRNNQEDSHLHTCRRENFKSYKESLAFGINLNVFTMKIKHSRRTECK
jgi:hypothetical protein